MERRIMAAALGYQGGKSTVRNLGKDHMKKIGKRGAKIRWKKHNLL